jgi:uncharacterized protein with PIN domain
MIVDSSAGLAVFFAEPEAAGIAELLATPGRKRIPAVNRLECAIKLGEPLLAKGEGFPATDIALVR